MSRRISELMRRNQRPDTAEEIAQRIADNYAREAVHAYLLRRFGPITAENADEVLACQEASLRALDRTVQR